MPELPNELECLAHTIRTMQNEAARIGMELPADFLDDVEQARAHLRSAADIGERIVPPPPSESG